MGIPLMKPESGLMPNIKHAPVAMRKTWIKYLIVPAIWQIVERKVQVFVALISVNGIDCRLKRFKVSLQKEEFRARAIRTLKKYYESLCVSYKINEIYYVYIHTHRVSFTESAYDMFVRYAKVLTFALCLTSLVVAIYEKKKVPCLPCAWWATEKKARWPCTKHNCQTNNALTRRQQIFGFLHLRLTSPASG